MPTHPHTNNHACMQIHTWKDIQRQTSKPNLSLSLSLCARECASKQASKDMHTYKSKRANKQASMHTLIEIITFQVNLPLHERMRSFISNYCVFHVITVVTLREVGRTDNSILYIKFVCTTTQVDPYMPAVLNLWESIISDSWTCCLNCVIAASIHSTNISHVE